MSEKKLNEGVRCYRCKGVFCFLRGDWWCLRCERVLGSGWGGVA